MLLLLVRYASAVGRMITILIIALSMEGNVTRM